VSFLSLYTVTNWFFVNPWRVVYVRTFFFLETREKICHFYWLRWSVTNPKLDPKESLLLRHYTTSRYVHRRSRSQRMYQVAGPCKITINSNSYQNKSHWEIYIFDQWFVYPNTMFSKRQVDIHAESSRVVSELESPIRLFRYACRSWNT
jgi:hypothetical protein